MHELPLVLLGLATICLISWALARWLPPLKPASAPAELAQARTCSYCKHFDLEEGQAVLAQHPAFLRAAAVVSPAQIGRRVEREYERDCKLCDGRGKTLLAVHGQLDACRGCGGTGKVLEQELSPPAAPQKAQWNQCGACLKDGVIVWSGDTKSCWEPHA